ncbi:MAG: type II toxin-antitoxin system RelE/ParE family toxin [Aliarcobacter sp.]|nr:type II toxin-antitoxin system RelE/ParE family toxin [Arcobacter sp.]
MNFVNDINNIDDLGINLGNNIYKVRIKNSDKNSGKSSGYRLISYLKLIENELYLMFIYDKSEIENINEKEIDKFILELYK